MADSLTIVMAEDSMVQGVILQRALLNNGYTVLWAKDGEEAIEFVNTYKPSLLITDVEMPRKNGFEVCRELKSSEEFRTLPIILCTSLSTSENIMMGLEVEADGYVTKPYDETYLMKRITSVLTNPPSDKSKVKTVDIEYDNKTFHIKSDANHILNMLLSTYENIEKQNQELFNTQVEVRKKSQQVEASLKESEELLGNILPKKIAKELKEKGFTEPLYYNSVTIIFTDFKGFTKAAENMTPKKLVNQLDVTFGQFDHLIDQYGLEKLKTIGDAYMCGGGLPEQNFTHPVDCVLAALEIIDFMELMKEGKKAKKQPYWELRLGIHTGPVVAGVIGTKKFAYDMWGDAVNTASRMESSGEPGKINISSATYEQVKDFFDCEYRGKVKAKNKGDIDMYFVLNIRPDLSVKGQGKKPNEVFQEKYQLLKTTGSAKK